ncbi:hypothetical protein FRC17_004494 [Serendipita sp. 399]|nr:hypothetical protein FRC17_004494 [Serendipita sp. 399]
MQKHFAALILTALSFALTVSAQILAAPVNTPTLIQTFMVNTRFAPCLQAAGNYDGAPVNVATCGNFNGPEKTWTVVKGGGVEGTTPNNGPITQIRVFGDKCLDVPNGNNVNGNKLQIWTCYDGNQNQLWRVNGDARITWANHNKCLDLTDGNLRDPVVRMQIWDCNNDGHQVWNAIPPRP